MQKETEYEWEGVGTLKIVDRGHDAVSLRYLPSLDVIAAELAKHRKTAHQRASEEDEQSTHRKTQHTATRL